jgi:ATP-dependent RNA helicase SUPV3L1/SUV3
LTEPCARSKIRRVIFMQASKPTASGGMQPLSDSQIKQIGGRAGRFGLHGAGDADAGTVSTMHATDLPRIRRAFARALPPLRNARMSAVATAPLFERLLGALPPGAGVATAHDAVLFAARLPHWAAVEETVPAHVQLIDALVRGEAARDRRAFALLPFAYRDVLVRDVVGDMISAHMRDARVELLEVLERHGLLAALARATKALVEGARLGADAQNVLMQLEGLHKALVAYTWAHFHWPSSFYAYGHAASLLRGAERAMEHVLRTLGELRAEKKAGKAKARGGAPSPPDSARRPRRAGLYGAAPPPKNKGLSGARRKV